MKQKPKGYENILFGSWYGGAVTILVNGKWRIMMRKEFRGMKARHAKNG